MKNIAPILVRTAYNFATHDRMLDMIEEDVTAEFIVHLLEILILLSGEQSYFEIFIEN
jgi:hypothetical protein